MKSWKEWCRLCAKYDGNITTDIFFKLEHLPDIPQLFNKHFDLMVTPYDGKPGKICEKCTEFILKIKQFAERCIKSDLMFSTLIYKLHDENEALCIRNQIIDDDYDLDIKEKKDQIIYTDQYTDTNDLNNDDKNSTNNIKEECNDNFQDLIYKTETTEKISNPLQTDNNENSCDESREDGLDTKSEDEDDEEEEVEPEKVKIKKKPVKKIRIKNYDGIFKCEKCGQVFTKNYSYRNHLKSRHSDSKFFCSQCPKSFATRHLLKLHEKVHLPDDLKLIHPCSFCYKKFSKAINVKAHIKAVHSNERSFICDECGKGFKTKGALQEHQLTHTDDRPFQCPECPKKFKSMARLKVHYDVHTDTKYPCQICGATFQLRRSLASHMDVHTDEKKYKCDFCGNDYKRYKALKRHLAAHTGFKHACSFCDKTFATSTNCKNHQKNVHPEEFAAEQALRAIEHGKT